MSARWLPNAVTFLRLAASPLLAWLLLRGYFRTAVFVVLLAGVTDWLDGYAARKLGASGTSGIVFDPLADKALLVTLFVVLGVLNLLPRWLMALAIGRDLVIVVGAFLLRVFRGHRRFLPSRLGKVSTFFQICLVLVVMLWASWPNPVFAWLRMEAILSTTLFTALSGVEYVRLGIRLSRSFSHAVD